VRTPSRSIAARGMVDAAEACEAIMDVENDQQAEECRNKESNSEEHDQLGRDTAL
jgi:hypothetical protein